ncbi:MAG TPA: anti-sigma regulatory factor [Gemmatimonadaceae bacterium]|nr:anti-sigma regulatory factor [Gemmatimonadaceae bacterium]
MKISRSNTTRMQVRKREVMFVRTSSDIVQARQAVRTLAIETGLGLVDQTKIVTAVSELARNTVDYGGGGTLTMEIVSDGRRNGLKLIVEDKGPGIADVNLALTDGYTTGSGMGLGLSGSRRLVNEFDIWSKPGEGTRVTVTRWK